MRFEVDCAKSHHRVISEGMITATPVDAASNTVGFSGSIDFSYSVVNCFNQIAFPSTTTSSYKQINWFNIL